VLTRLAARTGRYLVPGIAAAFLLAACGGDGDGTTIGTAAPNSTAVTAPTTTAAPTGAATSTGTSGTGPTTPESTPVNTRCHTSELAATIGAGDAAAGNRYATLSLKNTSGHTCTIYGYGGLQPLTSSGKQLPLTLKRDASAGGPRLVRLSPGTSVGRTIHWGVIPSGETTCPTATSATIIPPDETDPLTVKFNFGEICGSTIDGTPYGVTR
jgi:Protein of unknown function (DUF4232)